MCVVIVSVVVPFSDKGIFRFDSLIFCQRTLLFSLAFVVVVKVELLFSFGSSFDEIWEMHVLFESLQLLLFFFFFGSHDILSQFDL